MRNLTKQFARSRGWFAKPSIVKAVDDVSFSIEQGETFGLVGESGSGKTTTGRCILRLIEPTSGQVRFAGEDVLAFSPQRLRAARRGMQIVFQDPYASLNPRMRVGAIVKEPLDHPQGGHQGGAPQRASRSCLGLLASTRAGSRATPTSSAADSVSASAWRARSR